jgi:hypothetical protein
VFGREDPYRKEKIAATIFGIILFTALAVTFLLYMRILN